ncbi:hypothetical protein GCM10023230_24540 [Flavobacterium hankyongi]|uniref:Uncharacterized protein n=1 Tax=Flavobacterium hankyongi TaxID=1176532 RepID=A0ABP9A369_9FLAO
MLIGINFSPSDITIYVINLIYLQNALIYDILDSLNSNTLTYLHDLSTKKSYSLVNKLYYY